MTQQWKDWIWGLCFFALNFMKIKFIFALIQLLCNLFCRGMQQLLDYPEDDIEEAFCLNFTVSLIECLKYYQAHTIYYSCL